MFDVKDEVKPIKYEREKFDKESVKKVISQAVEKSGSTVEENEVTRIGKYVQGGNRPIKVRFGSQTAPKTVMSSAWKLSKKRRL